MLYKLTQEEVNEMLQDGEKDFQNYDLSGLDFSNRDLRECNFSGSDISLANFTGAILDNATMESVIIHMANFTNSSLVKTNITAEYVLYYPTLENTIFDGADCRECMLWVDDVPGGLVFASLKNANFAGAQIVGANFENDPGKFYRENVNVEGAETSRHPFDDHIVFTNALAAAISNRDKISLKEAYEIKNEIERQELDDKSGSAENIGGDDGDIDI